ncbi:MAG: hypothetical protein BWK80_00260 [Desulfobacteraceae bacterium IS3]|nr:MAG: hypothetical protein BWK80_00260 [Desulfobacteraceae bacterium IS3]
MYDKNVVNIMGKAVERIEYKGHPVLTFRMVDELHERPEGTARKSFHRNKAQLVENEDYFDVSYKEWSEILNTRLENRQRGGCHRSIIFLTQTGYLLLTKIYRSSSERILEICNKYFNDESLNFILRNAPETEFGKILIESLEGLATVRTQINIDKYRADFLLAEYGIIIEYDEKHHERPAHKKSDKERDKILSALGYRVIRIKKDESVGKSLNKILLEIFNN